MFFRFSDTRVKLRLKNELASLSSSSCFRDISYSFLRISPFYVNINSRSANHLMKEYRLIRDKKLLRYVGGAFHVAIIFRNKNL